MHRELLGILVISVCVGARLCAAAEPIAKPHTTPEQGLDEVLVQGTRLKELRATVVMAEDRFYERYNELNKVDDFDIECRVEAPIGTKIPNRMCLTKLQLKARADVGREYLQSLQDLTRFDPEAQGLGKPPDTNQIAVWSARYKEYKDNMLSLLKEYPDLLRLAREGEEAKKRFDAEYKRRFEGRLILVE